MRLYHGAISELLLNSVLTGSMEHGIIDISSKERRNKNGEQLQGLDSGTAQKGNEE